MFRKPSSVIVFLTFLNVLNFLDRYIIAAVGPAMQRDLHLTDGMLGMLGSAFLWGYLLTSPFFGRLADRFSRKAVIAFGLLLWSAATAATGVIGTLLLLIIVRLLAGAGESDFVALGPTALDEVTKPDTKGRILAIFYAAVPIGTALGFIYGGAFDAFFGWRAAFVVAGVVGLLFVPLCFWLQEPLRQDSRSVHRTLLDDFRSLIASRRYVWTAFGYAAQTFALGGFAFWAPTFLERKFAYPTATGNLLFGGIIILTGFIGTLVGGWILDHMRCCPDPGKRALLLSTIASLIGAPFAFVAVYTVVPWIFFASMAIVQLAVFATFSPISAVFLGSVHPAIRATAMGGSVFIGRLLGDAISIWLVGVLSDATGSLTFAMSVLPLALIIAMALWGLGARTEPLAGTPDAAAAGQ